MKPVAYAALLVPAVAAAQTQPQATAIQPQITTPTAIKPLIAPPIDLRNRFQGMPAPCLLRAPKLGSDVIGEKVIGEKVIGEKGSDAVIGEKGSDAVIGEKGSDAIIGEKVIGEKVIGEKSAPSTGSLSFGDRWNSSAPVSFRHVIAGPAGQLLVRLDACTSAPGGQLVRVQSEGGLFQQTLLAMPAGSSGRQVLILPKVLSSQLTRVPLTITVENPAGTPVSGYYSITVTR